MKIEGGLAPLSQPVSQDSVDPVRDYMRQLVVLSGLEYRILEKESTSQPVSQVSEPSQRGFMIGSVRL